MSTCKHLLELFEFARAGEMFEQRCQFSECLIRFRMILPAETSTEADDAENAQGIVANASGGIADETDQSFGKILCTIKRIIKFAGNGIPVKCIHRDIAPLCIVFSLPKDNAFGMSSIGCFIIFTKRRDFEQMIFQRHTYAAEHRRSHIGLRKNLGYLLRQGICRHIYVRRNVSKDHLAHGSTHPPRVESRIMQTLHDVVRSSPETRFECAINDAL